MNARKRHLLHDVLEESADQQRDATLLAAGRQLRHRRRRRVLVRGIVIMVLLGTTVFLFQRRPEPQPAPRILTSLPAPPVQRQELSDDELLALFPDTPVGLVTLEDGTKRLIFPRLGDEKRFITRM